MKTYYASIKEDLAEEERFYAELLKKADWKHLKEASELFLIHAYEHQLKGYLDTEVFADKNYKVRYAQFYLNLAVGLELLLKSILLKRGQIINRILAKQNKSFDPTRTLQFGTIVNSYLDKIFPTLSDSTLEQIKDILRIVNLRRNNVAHSSKKSHDSFRHEYWFSYLTLYIYEEFFHQENLELTRLLLDSINRCGKPKLKGSIDFKPFRIKPKSLR